MDEEAPTSEAVEQEGREEEEEEEEYADDGNDEIGEDGDEQEYNDEEEEEAAIEDQEVEEGTETVGEDVENGDPEEEEEEIEGGEDCDQGGEQVMEDDYDDSKELTQVKKEDPEQKATVEDDCVIIDSDDTKPNISKGEHIEVEPEHTGDLLLFQPDVYVFKIPFYNRLKNIKEFKSKDWNLNEFWNGSLKVISTGATCTLKFELEDELYGDAAIENYPGDKIHTVADSTRYYVLKLKIKNEEETVGFGFSNREDSAEFKKTLTTYFEVQNVLHVRRAAMEQLPEAPNSKRPRLDPNAFIMENASPIATQLRHHPFKSTGKNEAQPQQVVSEPIDPAIFVRQGLGTPGKFGCDLCSASFDDMRHIKSHWHKVHNKPHPCHCAICQLPFPDRREMAAHRIKYHGFECPDCSKSFKKARGLESHYLSVHQKRLGYPCPLSNCNANFPNKDALKNHVVNNHSQEDLSRIIYPCEEAGCNEKFLSPTDLVGHQLTHIKNIICEFCQESFRTKGNLRKHLTAVHPGLQVTKI